MQEASVLKPSALSLLLLRWRAFFLSVSRFTFTEKKSSCQCMPNACQLRKKLSVLTRVLLVRQWNLNFLMENLYFLISLTSEILVSNRKLQPFTAYFFWVWQMFFLSVHEYSLLFGKPDKEFACQLKWLTSKKLVSEVFRHHWKKKLVSKTLGLQWQTFCLSVDKFKNDWQAKNLSEKKCSFFDTTDK